VSVTSVCQAGEQHLPRNLSCPKAVRPVLKRIQNKGKTMKRTFRNFFKLALLSLAALVLIGATHQTARADEVTLTGSTAGAITAPGLIFTPTANFNGTTALGIGSLSGPNSLGSFFVATGPLQLTGGLFQLDITFTAPTGIA